MNQSRKYEPPPTGERLLIFGSRDCNPDQVRQMMTEELDRRKPTAIVTAGEPGGVCQVARELAQERSLPLTLHFKHRHRLGGQYHHRSVAALKDCNFALFFWNGSSQGTQNEIALAAKMLVPYQVLGISEPTDAAYGWDTTIQG